MKPVSNILSASSKTKILHHFETNRTMFNIFQKLFLVCNQNIATLHNGPGMEIVITRIGMEVLLDLVDMNKRRKGGGADGEVRDEVDIAIVIKIGVDT